MSSSNKLKIPLQKISLATNDFAEENIIGKGGYGVVYRGQSKQHGLLAIKRLNPGLGQGDHEYGMEINLLSKYKHENLVSLVGYCGEDGEKILVYKYEANRSLDKFLHSKDLSWVRRLQICLGAARGLRYLHDETGSEHVVIHRDIKCSNILLDENWNAKISDFGLSKIAFTNSANSVVFTSPCGTMGYVDPQILYGGITQKSDVYSFGVVLFEVLFGKLVALPDYLGQSRFTIQMAKKHFEEKTLEEMIDPDLRNEMNSDSLCTFSAVAYQCLKKRTEDRPTMSLVVEALEKALGYQQGGSTTKSFGLSSSSCEYLHDVYISFGIEEGELSSFPLKCLCRALKREGLSTYMENITTSRKESVFLEAIKQSMSFIIVFGRNIVAGSWKFDEVAEIMKCVKERGNVVLPLYFDYANPSEVKEQNGYFSEVMSKYDSTSRMEIWRNALVEAANVPGLQQTDFTFPADFAHEAAARIKRQLSRKNHSIQMSDFSLSNLFIE